MVWINQPPCTSHVFGTVGSLVGAGSNQEDLPVSNAAPVKPREAGDSFDFYVRHGRAVHAQVVRESLEMLLAWFRSRYASSGRGPPWEVVWPVSEASGCGRPVRAP
jgi:hypothetical protein